MGIWKFRVTGTVTTSAHCIEDARVAAFDAVMEAFDDVENVELIVDDGRELRVIRHNV